jgi:hypothetical protein
MRILDLDQFEVLFPVRSLFREGCRAKADLNPSGGAVRAKTGVLHVPQILAAGYGTFAQGSLLNRLEKGPLAAWPDTGAYQIAHGNFHFIRFHSTVAPGGVVAIITVSLAFSPNGAAHPATITKSTEAKVFIGSVFLGLPSRK